MLKNYKTRKVVICALVGSLGIACALWLGSVLNNFGNAPFEQSLKQREDRVHTVSPGGNKVPVKPKLVQSKKGSDQADKLTSQSNTSRSKKCSVRCESTLSMLGENLELDDETFQRLEVHVKEIAAYLQYDESQRQRYLHMALTTTDGDKRAFLTVIFSHLPYQQKLELAENFVGSDDWRVRADGVTLIAADENTLNLAVAETLLDAFSSEQHSYVKSSILNYLKKSIGLKGDAEILSQLDSAIYNEVDPSVRVAALKTKMQLSEQLYHIVPDALQALRTNEPEFQMAGLIVLEQVLRRDKAASENAPYIDKRSIQNEFQIITSEV